jgi:4-hydroxybenzoate polyprenyltransferase
MDIVNYPVNDCYDVPADAHNQSSGRKFVGAEVDSATAA